MVVSGISLLISTSGKIIKQDNLGISENKFDETTIKWRESNFVLEFAIDDGLEIERPILSSELPEKINKKYTELTSLYDKIYLEKVFKLGSEPSYEFYCYKDNKLTKFEFK